MALQPDFPNSPYAILDSEAHWFPVERAVRDTAVEKLPPPLVTQLRCLMKEFRDSEYAAESETIESNFGEAEEQP